MKPDSNNPYLQSRALWNDLYGHVQTKLENANRIIVILALVIVVAVVSMLWVSSRHQVKPYLTVLHGNQLLTTHDTASDEFDHLMPKLAIVMSEEFIQHSRSFSHDASMNKEHQIDAFAHATGPAVVWLKTQFRDVLVNQIRRVHVINILMKTNRTLSVRWSEDTLDAKSGERLSREFYSGEMQFAFQEPSSDEEIAFYNPLGFYITQIVFGKEQGVIEENHS